MDPNSARRVLRIIPDSPLTVELIERAYAGESWARHPSRYQDASERARAEEWAQTLATARDLLLAETRTPSTLQADAVDAPTPSRRGLSRGAIVGIVAGGVALVAVVTVAAIGAANLATQAVTAATEAIESEAADGGSAETGLADVERFSAGETMYTFPAALEIYNDGRYSADCPFDYREGCWQMALVTEADCDTMRIQLGFTNDEYGSLPSQVETIEKEGVLGNEPTVVIFGNDDLDDGWINQVTCLDPVS